MESLSDVPALRHPVSALQRFGQVRTLSPPWVAVHRVQVPFPSLQSAAEYIVTAFGGEEMTFKIAGGTKWWQVRAGQGVEAEWIVMKKDWKEVVAEEKRENEKRNGKKKEAEGEREDDECTFKQDLNGTTDALQSCLRWTVFDACCTVRLVISHADLPLILFISPWRSLLLGFHQHSPLYHLASCSQNARSMLCCQLPQSSPISLSLRYPRLPCSLPLSGQTAPWSTTSPSRSKIYRAGWRLCRRWALFGVTADPERYARPGAACRCGFAEPLVRLDP